METEIEYIKEYKFYKSVFFITKGFVSKMGLFLFAKKVTFGENWKKYMHDSITLEWSSR